MLPSVSGQEPWWLHAISETLSAINKDSKSDGQNILQQKFKCPYK